MGFISGASSVNRLAFNTGRRQAPRRTASCKMQGDMTMVADYDSKSAGNTITRDVKQKITGGGMPENMRNSTMNMVMTRQGDC